MRAFILPNGNLLIPKRAEGPCGVIGDGMVEVAPGTEDYELWIAHAEPLPEGQ